MMRRHILLLVVAIVLVLVWTLIQANIFPTSDHTNVWLGASLVAFYASFLPE